MGGLSGHMMHPHDNYKLTIEQFVGLLSQAMRGKLAMSEKLDGFNIHYLKFDGKLKLARNGQDLIEGGFNYDDIDDRFSNDRVREVFRQGYKLIYAKTKWEKLPDFKDTGVTVNAEIIVKGITNIMLYGESAIVPHNIYRWMLDGDKYKVVDIRDTILPKPQFSYAPMTVADVDEVLEALCRQEFNQLGLTMGDTLLDYYHARYAVVMMVQFPEYVTRCPKVLEVLFNRFFGIDKTNLRIIRKMTNMDIQPLLDAEKNIMKVIKEPLDHWVLSIGTTMIERARGINADAGKQYRAAAYLEEELSKSITNPEFTRRWGYCGNKIFGMEGIVVKYMGDLYKFTGPFAPINQLLGGNR